MSLIHKTHMMSLPLAVLAAGLLGAQALPPELKAKVDARVAGLKALGADATVVGAVKAYNANPSAEAKAMTNEKWKGLSVLDPFVRSLSKNSLAEYLKAKKDADVAECFVSGADGAKVAFLSKTTAWNHKGKPKHDSPMTGKVWYGPLEVDESTGIQEVQVGVPVTDGGKPVGSIVFGLNVAKLK